MTHINSTWPNAAKALSELRELRQTVANLQIDLSVLRNAVLANAEHVEASLARIGPQDNQSREGRANEARRLRNSILELIRQRDITVDRAAGTFTKATTVEDPHAAARWFADCEELNIESNDQLNDIKRLLAELRDLAAGESS